MSDELGGILPSLVVLGVVGVIASFLTVGSSAAAGWRW